MASDAGVPDPAQLVPAAVWFLLYFIYLMSEKPTSLSRQYTSSLIVPELGRGHDKVSLPPSQKSNGVAGPQSVPASARSREAEPATAQVCAGLADVRFVIVGMERTMGE